MSGFVNHSSDDYLILGKVGKPHGLRGDVKIVCFSEQPENFSHYRELFLLNSSGGISGTLTIVNYRIQGSSAIVKFAELASRTDAEKLTGQKVVIAKSELPTIAGDEFYWHQYIGKEVLQSNGVLLGKIKELFNNGAQDILVVVRNNEEILIPVTKETVVEEERDKLIVELPPGLVELNNPAS